MVSEPAWAALLRTGAQPCGGNKRFFISVSELAQEPSDGGSVRGNASGSFQFSRKFWQGDFAILRYQSFPETLTDINNVAPIAEEGFKQIKGFYRIEAQIKGMSADERRTIRQEKTLPRIEAFEQWLAYSRGQLSVKSPTGLALKYIAKY